MEYRKLGNSEIEVSVIAFGAWAIGGWMWGGTDKKAAEEAMKVAFERGITSFDTAPIYGFGTSEELVGETLNTLPRDQVQILTKYGLRWDTTEGSFYFDSQDADGKPMKIHKFAGKQSVIQECEDSLRRLKTDYIDLLQIHWPDTTTPIPETMEAVEQLMKEGKIRAAGVSNYDASQMSEANQAISLASNQVPYSMVNRGIENAVVPYALENNIGILAYSPLQRGLLTGKIKANHTFAQGDHRPSTKFFSPENLEKTNTFLDELRPMAEDKGATLAQLVIAWTVRQSGITCALVGARNQKQAEENAKAADLDLSDSEISEINQHLDALELDV